MQGAKMQWLKVRPLFLSGQAYRTATIQYGKYERNRKLDKVKVNLKTKTFNLKPFTYKNPDV